jgi:hypothetical protein
VISKDLVPVHSKELVRTDESPCPLWDAELHAILADIHAMAQDHELFPLERGNYRSTYESKLRKHVEKVEAGRWFEELPEPPSEPDTQVLAATWRLTDEEISRQFNQVVADHLAWMDAQHQEALREIRGS